MPPSPMIPMLQKLPVSVHSIYTFKEAITYALALERGGDEALLQVIAKVEVALFVGQHPRWPVGASSL